MHLLGRLSALGHLSLDHRPDVLRREVAALHLRGPQADGGGSVVGGVTDTVEKTTGALLGGG